MGAQPEWVFVANLGDVNPIDYGGLFVFTDSTGVYDPECESVEMIDDSEDDEDRQRFIVHRWILEPCTFIDGVLSDNPYHPDSPAWFADDLGAAARCCDVELDELRWLFCSADAVERAQAWRVVRDYWGEHELDSYPMTFSRAEIEKRYEGLGF